MRIARSNRAIRVAAVLSGLFIFSSWGVAAEWQIETVDRSGPAEFTSMKIDKNGNIHVAYIPNVAGHPLKYAFWDQALHRWFSMRVTGTASFCTLALDSQQRPHISFADHGTGVGAKLRHAYWDGASWKVQPIEIPAGGVVAYYTSIALDGNDNPFLSFYDYADQANNFRLRMRSVFWMGTYWEVRVVDPQGGSGKFNSIAVDTAGRPHIAYANVKYETSGLRYASWTGTGWTTEIVEGLSGPCPIFSVNQILDKDDNPHISYTLTEQRLVKYATRHARQWETEVVDSIQQEAYPDRNGIALDSQGDPYVSYYDNGLGILKIANRRNGKWYGEVLDRDLAGFTSSLAIDHDTVWVSYADNTGQALKVAHRPIEGMVSSQKRGVK
jgi:hypothetical protein